MYKRVICFFLVCFIGFVVSQSVSAQAEKYYLNATITAQGTQVVNSQQSILMLDAQSSMYSMANMLGVTQQAGKFKVVDGCLVLYNEGGTAISKIFTIPDPTSFRIGGDQLLLRFVPTAFSSAPIGIRLFKVGTSGASSDEKPTFSSPEKVLEQLFTCARSGDLTQLQYLCDPQHRGDGVTECICSVTPSYKSQFCKNDISPDVFKAMFKNGKISGSAKIDGIYAVIPFLYGPNNEYQVMMKMVRRGQFWYLSNFLVG